MECNDGFYRNFEADAIGQALNLLPPNILNLG